MKIVIEAEKEDLTSVSSIYLRVPTAVRENLKRVHSEPCKRTGEVTSFVHVKT